jgi:predicted adenylyl cyclase CyaB
MASNLEYKTSCADHRENIRRAAECGANDHGVLSQEDTYFAVPVGRLKLRRFGDGTAELIGYTRPDLRGARRSEYVKIAVNAPEEVLRTFAALLGVRTTVRKQRRLFLRRGCRIHLDEVEGLGCYLEFEVPVPGEADPDELLEELLGIFGVSRDAAIPGSYADLQGQGPEDHEPRKS